MVPLTFVPKTMSKNFLTFLLNSCQSFYNSLPAMLYVTSTANAF